MKSSVMSPILLSILSLSLLSCDLFSHNDEGEPEVFQRRELPRELDGNEVQVIDGAGRFGFELMQRIVEADPEEDHFISPLSIVMAYGMLLNGAEDETYEQVRDVLGLEEMDRGQINKAAQSLIELLTEFDDQVTFNIANSIWYRDTFEVESDFLQTNRNYFNAVIEAADFDDPATADRINAWVEDHTEGLIDEIVEPPIHPLTVMYLINAIYFNGEWTLPFDPENTEPKPFYHADGTESEVDMMRLEDAEEMRYGSGEDYQTVKLYYGDAGFAMTLVLPDEDVGVRQWLEQMDWQQWSDLAGSHGKVTLDLEMPKFELEYEIDNFKRQLQAMGMENAFDPELSDFSRINTVRDDLYVSDTRHKTFIRVDEEGTEAAAVTSIEVAYTSVPQRVQIRFDRPYFYMIHEVESGSPLFMGVMNRP